MQMVDSRNMLKLHKNDKSIILCVFTNKEKIFSLRYDTRNAGLIRSNMKSLLDIPIANSRESYRSSATHEC